MTDRPLIELPDSACAAEILFGIDRVVGATASPYTLEGQFYKWPGERWKVDFTLPPITSREIANEWKAFGARLQGKFGTFYLGDPSAPTPIGVATGSPKVSGGGQLGNVLNTEDWTPGVTGILKAGDYIQVGIGSAARLHMVVIDADSDTSGNAPLTIEPALRYAPNDQTVITVQNPVGIFQLTSNTWSWRVSPGPIYRISFSAEEVVNA